jgi:hypothetical protein
VNSDNPESLRPQIRSARAKLVWEIKQIKSQLGLIDSPSKDNSPSANGAPAAPQRPTVKRGKENGKLFRTALNAYERSGILGEGAKRYCLRGA